MNEITVAHIWMGGVIVVALIYGICYFIFDALGKENREKAAKLKQSGKLNAEN